MNHTFSLRLSKYLADWVITKYGDSQRRTAPVTMPTAHPVGKIIYRYLKSNPTFQRWSNKCYCEMMHKRAYDLPKEMQEQLPNEDGDYVKQRDVWVQFHIPETHYYDGRLIQCDDTMQLESQSVTEVIDFLKEEFWNDFEDYAETYFRCQSIITNTDARVLKEFEEDEQEEKKPKRKIDSWDMVLDFCEFWQIEVDATDAIYRQMHRLIKQEKIQVVNSPRRRRHKHNNT